MNATELLAMYERVADAPDAVARLRRFVLDLAVRGKLVEQEDGSHDQLGRGSFARLATDRFFDVPDGWRWARLSELGTLRGGGTPSKARPDFWDGAVPWVSPKDMKRDYLSSAQMTVTESALAGSAANLIPAGSVLFVVRGMILAHSFPVGIATVPLTINQDMKALVLAAPEIGEYLLRALKGMKPFMLMRVQRSSHGTCRLEGADYSDFSVPIPPPAEQRRIVAKVDELMALCDQLEAARMERETARDRLAAASLARLNAPDPDTFQADARFALEVLPALSARPDQVKQLRQTILNLAVRGNLVPQEPRDERAIDWLTRSCGGNRSRSASSEGLLALPSSWAWIELGSLISTMDAGWSPQCEDHPRRDIRSWGVLKTTAVQSLAFDCSQHKELPTKLAPRSQHEARVGDILVTRAGPKHRVGVSCVVDAVEPRLMISDKLIRMRVLDGIAPRFIALCLNAGPTCSAIESAKSGMAVMQMNISQEKLRAVPIPLAPLDEQHRIVVKVDELMALCDQLECSIAVGESTRSGLLDALLQEALELSATVAA